MLPGADTIAAVATARGQSALAIVRLSGPRACSIAARCFKGADLMQSPTHTAHVGFVTGPDGHPVDQVVATVFHAPRTATGEETVEFTCHGGDVAPSLVLEVLLAAGACLAEPGEFTQRAFLNGKLDLAQAEAIADLIHASSRRAYRASLVQLRGQYSMLLAALRDELLQVTALVELELDFAEEDVEFAARDEVETLLCHAQTLLNELVGSYRFGQYLREGVQVVIAGRPNAGKSTLLNRLLGYDRAIVSPTPGTTRDAVEAEAEIGGLRFRFVDTAGLRITHDAIEAEGVRRAEAYMAEADVLIYLYDVTVGLERAEQRRLAELQQQQPVLVVANKSDLLPPGAFPEPIADLTIAAGDGDHPGVDRLVEMLLSLTEARVYPEASPVVTNQRHRMHMVAALKAVKGALSGLKDGISGDLLATDLRAALAELGAITGAITNEEVLDQIFSRFCIGK